MCFCFNGDKKLYKDVGFDSNIKYGVNGDELLQVSNLVCSFFVIRAHDLQIKSPRETTSLIKHTIIFIAFTEFLLLLSRVINILRFENEKENTNDATSNRK